MDERIWDRLAPVVAGTAGGIALIAAVAMFARWAVTEGFIGQNPIIGVILGLVTGAAALGAAEVSWRGQRPLAQGLAGSGLAILSFAIYAGHAWVGAFGSPVALVGLTVVAALGVAVAVRRDSQLVAVLGLVGGLVTPLMLDTDRSAFLVYAMVLNVGVGLASAVRGWRVVPWIAVGATIGLTLYWSLAGPIPTSWLAPAGLLAIGLSWLAAAGSSRVDEAVARPYLAGLPFGLLAVLLPLAGPPTALVTAVGLGALVAAGSWAVRRHTDGPWVPLTLALGLAAVGTLVARLGVLQQLTLLPALGLLVVGIGASWALQRDSVLPRVTAAVIALPVVVAFAAEPPAAGTLAAVAVALAALGELVDRSRSLDRVPQAGIASLVASALAAGLLTLETAPGLAMFGAGAVLALAWGPRFVRPSDQGVHWLPVFAALPLLAPALFAWRAAVGDHLDGVVPVTVALLALISAWTLRDVDEPARQVGTAAWGGIALVGTAVAVPLQLQAQWLTIGWAFLGLAVVGLARRSRSDGLALAGLGLLAIVVVRLVANPAVLSYHLTATPQPLSWVLYGYTLPVLALVGAARLLRLDDTRRSLQDALGAGLQLAAIGVGFAGINLFVSHAFAGGATLSLIDESLSANLFRTLSWMGFGVGLLWLGAPLRGRLGALVMALGVAKVLAVDLWLLPGLGKALVLLGVALALFGGAWLMQRAARPQSAA